MFKNMGGNIPGGNFLGGNFPGESLMGGNFPGDSFPDTVKNVADKTCNRRFVIVTNLLIIKVLITSNYK